MSSKFSSTDKQKSKKKSKTLLSDKKKDKNSGVISRPNFRHSVTPLSLTRVPDEVYIWIFGCLSDVPSLLAVRSVSFNWNRIAGDDDLLHYIFSRWQCSQLHTVTKNLVRYLTPPSDLPQLSGLKALLFGSVWLYNQIPTGPKFLKKLEKPQKFTVSSTLPTNTPRQTPSTKLWVHLSFNDGEFTLLFSQSEKGPTTSLPLSTLLAKSAPHLECFTNEGQIFPALQTLSFIYSAFFDTKKTTFNFSKPESERKILFGDRGLEAEIRKLGYVMRSPSAFLKYSKKTSAHPVQWTKADFMGIVDEVIASTHFSQIKQLVINATPTVMKSLQNHNIFFANVVKPNDALKLKVKVPHTLFLSYNSRAAMAFFHAGLIPPSGEEESPSEISEKDEESSSKSTQSPTVPASTRGNLTEKENRSPKDRISRRSRFSFPAVPESKIFSANDKTNVWSDAPGKRVSVILQSVPFGTPHLDGTGSNSTHRSIRRIETLEKSASRRNGALYNTSMFSEAKPDSMDLTSYFPFLTLPLTQEFAEQIMKKRDNSIKKMGSTQTKTDTSSFSTTHFYGQQLVRLSAVDFDTLMAPACKYKPFLLDPLSQPSWAQPEASEFDKWVETNLANPDFDFSAAVVTPEMLQTKQPQVQQTIKPKEKPEDLQAQETKAIPPKEPEVGKTMPEADKEEESLEPIRSPRKKRPSEGQQDKKIKPKLKRKPTVSQKALQSKMSRTFEAVSKVEHQEEEVRSASSWNKPPAQSVFNFWRQTEAAQTGESARARPSTPAPTNKVLAAAIEEREKRAKAEKK